MLNVEAHRLSEEQCASTRRTNCMGYTNIVQCTEKQHHAVRLLFTFNFRFLHSKNVKAVFYKEAFNLMLPPFR